MTNKGININHCDVVYKSYYNNYVIVMRKLPQSITNESKIDVYDLRHAKFRASVLNVVLIISKHDDTLLDRIVNIYNMHVTEYIVHKNVYPHTYDENIDLVCGSGIHYYKTLFAAFEHSTDRVVPYSFTGIKYYWHSNGRVSDKIYYVNGKKSGPIMSWTEKDILSYNGEYTKDIQTGK